MENLPGSGPSPRRTLGVFDATNVVIGAIIGVGIFFTPSGVVSLTGSGGLALLAWGAAGTIALLGALSFAQLGRRYHASGAQYEVLRDAYGPAPAFAFVLCNATAIQGGAIGVIAMICATNLTVAVTDHAPGDSGAETWKQLGLASVLILGVTVANIVGVRWGSRIQNLTVVAKVLTLLLVTGLAIFATPSHPQIPAPSATAGSPIQSVLAALVPAFFAYGGWQHALWISGEVKDPERNLPRAIVAGTLLVVAIYLLANWAYLALLGPAGVAGSKTLAADAVSSVWPQFGGRGVAAAVCLSAFGVLNAQLLSGPRLIYGMARDGRFFSPFALLHSRFATPVVAILLLAVTGWVLMVASASNKGLAKGINLLLTGAVFIDGVFFALTGAAVILLTKRGKLAAPLWAFAVAALFVIGELGIVAGACLNPDARLAPIVGTAWIVAAAALYFVRFSKRRILGT